MFIHCQPKDFRSRSEKDDVVTLRADPETRLLASIFGTLLSSQGSDAHRSCAASAAWLRGNPSILPASILGVKSVSRRPSGLDATDSSALGSLRGSPLYQSLRCVCADLFRRRNHAGGPVEVVGVSPRDRPSRVTAGVRSSLSG